MAATGWADTFASISHLKSPAPRTLDPFNPGILDPSPLGPQAAIVRLRFAQKRTEPQAIELHTAEGSP